MPRPSARALRPSSRRSAARCWGSSYKKIRVIHGQTDRIAHGLGAFASRVTVMTGEATRIAACKVRAKALETAAELLQAPADALDIVDGRVVRAGAAVGPSIALGDVARALAPTAIPTPREPGLSAEGWFHANHMTYPYGVHVAVVAIDRDTGAVASNAISSPTISAARSIRCWSKARSSADSCKGWAALCSRSFCTTSAANRFA